MDKSGYNRIDGDTGCLTKRNSNYSFAITGKYDDKTDISNDIHPGDIVTVALSTIPIEIKAYVEPFYGKDDIIPFKVDAVEGDLVFAILKHADYKACFSKDYVFCCSRK